MFVARATRNPEADLQRGWSAWGGQFKVTPLDLADVENAMLARDLNEDDVMNAIPEDCLVQTPETDEFEAGWEIADTDEARAAIAEWCRDELDVDVQRCPVTGRYGSRHHWGLSSYELSAETVEDAKREALSLKDKVTWSSGGVTGLKPKAYYPTSHEYIFVFDVEELGAQADS